MSNALNFQVNNDVQEGGGTVYPHSNDKVHETSCQAGIDGGGGHVGVTASTQPAAEDDPTIASVYSGSPTGSSSVRNWIEAHRYREGNTRDLCLSDDSEARFLAVMSKGAKITRTQVGI